MKVFQVRISDELGKGIDKIAEERGVTLVRVVRDALDQRIQSESFAREGRRLYVEDPTTGERVELIILGLTKR